MQAGFRSFCVLGPGRSSSKLIVLTSNELEEGGEVQDIFDASALSWEYDPCGYIRGLME